LYPLIEEFVMLIWARVEKLARIEIERIKKYFIPLIIDLELITPR